MDNTNIITGIYRIKNIEDGKVYIGLSGNINKRFEQHKRLLRNNKHYNMFLQDAWNLYKENKFKFGILEICSFRDIYKKEKRWSKIYKSRDINYGYNIMPCGNNLGLYRGYQKDRIKESIDLIMYKKLYLNNTLEKEIKLREAARDSQRMPIDNYIKEPAYNINYRLEKAGVMNLKTQTNLMHERNNKMDDNLKILKRRLNLAKYF